MSKVKFEEVKNSIKAEMEKSGKKYPTNINGLSDAFICEVFAPKLPLEEIVKIDAKRDEFRAKGQPSKEGEKPSGNWFPAFRAWVGKEYFAAEFEAKKTSKKSEDKNGNSLKELIAKMGKAN